MPRLLGLGVGVRFINDTSVQIFGPFLGAIAGGLGVSIVSVGALNGLRSMMGLMAPVVGSIADSIGYRTTMRAALLAGALGTLLFALSTSLWVAVIGLIFMGLGAHALPPVLQAYISAQIPYTRRSRALGIVEYGWALAGVVGLSASGLLIDRLSWRAPFLVMSALLLLSFFVFAALPATPGARSRQATQTALFAWRQWPRRFLSLIHLESNARSAWSAIFVNALNVFAATTITIVYGVWLAGEYGLSTTALGLVALALGLSELTGSVLVSLLGDRLGKYRSILAATILSVAAYLLLPLLNFEVAPIVAGLVTVRFLFEVSIVSNISLLSEQVPTQRGKVLTLATAMVTTGVAAASVVGPVAYSRWGIWAPAIIAAVTGLVSTVLVLVLVEEQRVAGASGAKGQTSGEVTVE